MKKYLFLMLIGAGALLSSCNQDLLEIPQKGVVGYDQFYNTDEDAESALVSMYADFAQNIGGYADNCIYNPYMAAFNLCGDDLYAAGEFYGDNDFMAEMNEFRYDSTSDVVINMYKRLYWTNHKCNLITDNFEYGESAIKDRVISEARVIRAWIHMMLAIGWNNPPLVDHVLQGSDKPQNYEGGQKGLLEWCAKECDEAIQYLEERADVNDKNATVKVTKGLAWTIAGKARLFAGDYAGAKTALGKVISSGKYALVPGERWSENFHKVGDGNEEKIFETNINWNPAIGAWGGQIQRSTWMHLNIWCWRADRMPVTPTNCADKGWGGLGVREDFAEEMLAYEGDSYRRKGTFMTEEEFFYTGGIWPSDAELTTLEEKKVDAMRGISDVRGLYGQGKYMHCKRIVSPDDKVTGQSFGENNFLIFRYAEVLLMYAEACVQTGDDGSGLKALNEVQKRAGAPVTALTLDAVKREKKYEMWLEGVRWPDMVRWGDFDGVINSGKNIPQLYDEFFIKDTPGFGKEHKFKVTYSEPNAEKTVGYQEKYSYFPFPYSVISINPNLVQREGF